MDASILENVLYHRSIVDAEAAVWSALRQAHLDEFVRGLPDGLMTNVGERGARLSGGQRQRLGIARALVGNPQLLVLDEATSALDGTTERAISKTIHELHGQLTLIIIAHRLSTVRACDRLILLEAGRVTASGTFDELRVASDTFRRMVAAAAIAPELREPSA
jgi:ABC-type multidrug transport system fused ATPase/permease subunit